MRVPASWSRGKSTCPLSERRVRSRFHIRLSACPSASGNRAAGLIGSYPHPRALLDLGRARRCGREGGRFAALGLLEEAPDVRAEDVDLGVGEALAAEAPGVVQLQGQDARVLL